MTADSPPELPDDEDASSEIAAAHTVPEGSVFAAEVVDGPEAPPQTSRRPHPHIGWALLWILGFWSVQVAVSVVVVVVALIVAIAQDQTSPEEMDQAISGVTVILIPIGTLASVVTAIVIASLFYRRQFGRRLALRGMAPQQWLASLLAVLPLAVIASEVTNWAGEFLPSFNAEMLGEFAASPWPLVFVAACLFPAVGEEIFCRGFLGRGLVANHGAVVGVLLASLLFGVMHIDPVQSVGAFVLGLGLHFIYLTTRSLLAPILVHLLNNAFAFWVMRNYQWCPLPGLTPLPDDTLVHTPPSVMIAAIAAAAAVLGMLYQMRTRWLLTNEDSENGATVWSPGYMTAEQPPLDVDCRAAAARPKLWLAAIVVLSYFALLAALAIESQAALAR